MAIETWPAPGPPVHGSPPHSLPAGPARTWKVNQLVLDSDGVFWRCTTPGVAEAEFEALPAAGVAEAVAALVDSAPGTLDTLDELAAALGDDANFASTVAAGLVPTGGTTGQVLAKQSNSDRDTEWIPAPSGASGLTTLTVPTDAASWDVAGATGTWDFSVPGVISQTDPTQTGAFIFCKDPIVSGLGYVLECEVRWDVTEDPDGGGAGFFGLSCGSAETAAALGLTSNTEFPSIDAYAYGDQGGGPNLPTSALGDWTACKLTVWGGFAVLESPVGTQIEVGFPPTQNGWGFDATRFVITQVFGAVSFRNLKAGAIAVPTLA